MQPGGGAPPPAEPVRAEEPEEFARLLPVSEAPLQPEASGSPFTDHFFSSEAAQPEAPLADHSPSRTPDLPLKPKIQFNIEDEAVKHFPVEASFARMLGMNQPIILVSGSKGGVGKSLTTMALLDYFAVNHKYMKLIDADTNNPDVFRCYGGTTEGEVVDLDDVDGWIRLVNVCDASPFKTIVVNTPAQSNAAVHKHAPILLDSLRELARPLITLWVINRQRDSLELLKDYMEHMNGGIVHVVRNGYFGEEKKFELYQNSALRDTVGGQGGKDLFLPDLADRVTDDLYGKRTTISEAAQQFKLGDRAELQRWRAAVAAMFAEVGV